ncbi:phage head closure protein [Thermosyntropha sp.]|uniref:phage head closure protein n=1 Tax=Thermosyntropha sp. TaxID=2740820 RepID=UPI0025E78EC8|nr:phage head closure protein [Thermosyntropha sp.]MBO8158832.1 phage head closure protein [Thermosyntropha sp.]
MRIGDLRHRITIQEFVEQVDEYGTPIGAGWQDVCTVWAAVEPIQGREYILLQNTQSEVTIRIRIRFQPGIKPAMRVKYGNRIFDIQSVIDPEERHIELQLMCKEVFK